MAVDIFGNPVNQNFVLPQQQDAAPAKKKPNFLQSLFPSIGGLVGGVGGGAAGGALAGTAVLPGVGTAVGGLLGALLGGGAGGAIGKVAENRALGDSAGHDVLKEGLIQGALSAGPIRLLKGAAAGGRALLAGGEALGADAAAQGGGRLLGALNAGGEAAAAPGILSRAKAALGDKGAQIEARAGGFGVGEKVAGSPPLGYYDSAHVGDILKSNGIKPGAPESRLKAVEDALGGHGQKIDLHLAANNGTLAPTARTAIATDFINSVEQQPGVSDAVRKSAENLAKNFENQVKDTKGIVDFRRGLDQQVIAFNRNPDAKMAADQLAARTFRNVLTDATDNLAPGMTNLNHSYADLMHAKEFLVGGSKAVSDQSQSAGGGLIGRILSSDTSQAAKSRLGSALQTAAGKGAEAASPFGAKAIAARSLPPNLLGALSGQAVTMNSTNNPSSMSNTDITNSGYDGLQGKSIPGVDAASSNNGISDASNPFDVSNVDQNVQKILSSGGKMKDVADYISLVDALQGIKAKGNPSQPKLSAVQQQRSVAAQNALSDIGTIQSAVDSGKLGGAKALPGAGTAIGSKLLGTENLDAALFNVADNILRARSGAATPPEEVKRFMSNFLPRPTDSQAAKIAKLERAKRELQGYINPTSAVDVSALALQ